MPGLAGFWWLELENLLEWKFDYKRKDIMSENIMAVGLGLMGTALAKDSAE